MPAGQRFPGCALPICRRKIGDAGFGAIHPRQSPPKSGKSSAVSEGLGEAVASALFGWADRFRQSANAVGDQSAAIGRDAAKLGNVALSRLADEIEPRPPFALAVANGVSVSSAPSADARTKTADLKAIRTDPKPGIVTAREHAHACAVHPSDGSPCSAPTLRNVPTTRH
jgi:hypothetical protein